MPELTDDEIKRYTKSEEVLYVSRIGHALQMAHELELTGKELCAELTERMNQSERLVNWSRRLRAERLQSRNERG